MYNYFLQIRNHIFSLYIRSQMLPNLRVYQVILNDMQWYKILHKQLFTRFRIFAGLSSPQSSEFFLRVWWIFHTVDKEITYITTHFLVKFYFYWFKKILNSIQILKSVEIVSKNSCRLLLPLMMQFLTRSSRQTGICNTKTKLQFFLQGNNLRCLRGLRQFSQALIFLYFSARSNTMFQCVCYFYF